jgi:hypothetical protein
MHGLKTDEAAVRGEEQVSIGTSQTRKCVESDTIDGYENRRGKARLREELDPVDVMIIRHMALNYSNLSNDSHLYTGGTVMDVSLKGYERATRQWGK